MNTNQTPLKTRGIHSDTKRKKSGIAACFPEMTTFSTLVFLNPKRLTIYFRSSFSVQESCETAADFHGRINTKDTAASGEMEDHLKKKKKSSHKCSSPWFQTKLNPQQKDWITEMLNCYTQTCHVASFSWQPSNSSGLVKSHHYQDPLVTLHSFLLLHQSLQVIMWTNMEFCHRHLVLFSLSLTH